MAKKQTFDDACSAWEALMSRTDAAAAEDEPLIEIYEQLILDHAVISHHHASHICAVLGEGIACGPRSDGRDKKAMARLELWLRQQADASRPPTPGVTRLDG